MLITILLAICFTWAEPSSLEGRDEPRLRVQGVMLLREGSPLLFPALRLQCGYLWQSGDLIQVMLSPCVSPPRG